MKNNKPTFTKRTINPQFPAGLTEEAPSGIDQDPTPAILGARLRRIRLRQGLSVREMAAKAGLVEHIDFKVGDAVELIEALPAGIDFVLLDLWKDLYTPCLEAFYPKLNPGAIIVSDNMIEPAHEHEAVMRYQRAVRSKPKMTSILVPVGSGLEISRYDA